MLADYAQLGGTEILNSARAAAYTQAAGLLDLCDPCPTLPQALGHDPYTTPAEDDAPWYDPVVPESAGVLGVFAQSVVGLSSNPVARSPQALVGDGSALGVLRRTHREIAYTALLVAEDECSLSYGLEWLAAALRGAECGPGPCAGDTLCMYSCCPPEDSDGARELRHLFDVGLLEGPTVSEVQYLEPDSGGCVLDNEVFGGGVIATVEWTLVAGTPQIFREPLEGTGEWADLADGLVVALDPDLVHEYCPDPEPCLDDPECPPPALPPRPPIPVGDCYPTGVDTFLGSVLALHVTEQPAWLSAVPVIEVEAGTQAMRRLVLRFWINPAGVDCWDVEDPCQACWMVTIPYLPRGSTLRIDGRVQRATVTCPGEPGRGDAVAPPTLYGPGGTSYQWPEFSCGTGLCIEVLSLLDDTAPTARARVELVPRSDAA